MHMFYVHHPVYESQLLRLVTGDRNNRKDALAIAAR